MSFKKHFDKESKITDAKAQMKRACPNCGRKMHFYAYEKTDRILCDWCGKYIFKTKKAEFDYRIKEQINKQKRG